MSRPMSEAAFVQLYIKALRDTTLSSDARWVGVLMTTFIGKDGLAWPNTTTLMNLTGWGERRVKQARAEVVRAKWFDKIRERSARGTFQRQSASVKYKSNPKVVRRENGQNPKKSP